jgi:WD40 repeat protein
VSDSSLPPQDSKKQKAAIIALGNASHLVAVSVSSRLYIVDYGSGLDISDLGEIFSSAANCIGSAAFSHNDEMVAALIKCGRHFEVKIWNTHGGNIMHTLAGSENCTCVAFSSSDNMLLFDSGKNIVKVCLLTGQVIAEPTTLTDYVTHLFTHPSGVILL